MSAMLTADWFLLGRDLYYRKFEIYSMGWQQDINIENLVAAVAPYGGPIALMRDKTKAVKVQGSTHPMVPIYSPSGKKLAAIKIKIISADKGRCLSELEILPEQTNVFKKLHGGFATTLVDVLSTCALLAHDKGDCAHVSIKLNIDFIKGADVGDVIVIDANTLKVGKNLAFLDVEIRDKASGELLVKGTHTKYLFLDKKMT